MTTLDPIPLGRKRPSLKRVAESPLPGPKIQKRNARAPSVVRDVVSLLAEELSKWEQKLAAAERVCEELKRSALFRHPMMVSAFTEHHGGATLTNLSEGTRRFYLELLDAQSNLAPNWPLDGAGNVYAATLFRQLDLLGDLGQKINKLKLKLETSKVNSRKRRIVHCLLRAGYSRDAQMRLKKHQLAGVFFMNCLEQRLLLNMDAASTGGVLAHEVGAGKTLQALALAVLDKVEHRQDYRCSLVVASKSIVPQWKPEFERFFGKKNRFFRVGWTDGKNTHVYDGRVFKGLPTTHVLEHHDMFIVHYELLTTLYKRCGLREIVKGYWQLEQWDRRARELGVHDMLGGDEAEVQLIAELDEYGMDLLKGKSKLGDKNQLLWSKFLRGEVKFADWKEILNVEQSQAGARTGVAFELRFENVSRLEMAPLLAFDWRRVIVDEAHIMRNPESDYFTVLSALTGSFRWCVTGTPQWHKDQDQWALFKFLRVRNLSKRKDFVKRYIGTHKYNDLLKKVFHRVTAQDLSVEVEQTDHSVVQIRVDEWAAEEVLKKETKDLPPCYIRFVWLDGFAHAAEVENYKQLTGHATDVRDEMADDPRNTMVMLSIVNNARIMCMGAAFKPKWFSKMDYEEEARRTGSVVGFKIDTDGGFADLRVPLEVLYHIVSYCESAPETMGALACTSTGLQEYVGSLAPPRAMGNPFADFDLLEAKKKPSTKFDAVFYYIENCIKADEKAIVFCEWKKPLKVIHLLCHDRGIKAVYLDGESKNRQGRLAQFKEDASRKLLLCTYCVGTGVNGLQLANHVLVLNPWWAKNREMQALARAHRLGQKRPVHVVYFLIGKTVERMVRRVATDSGKRTAEITRAVFDDLCKEPAFF